MKRKMLLVALVLVCALTCAFGLVACDNGNNDNGGTGNNGSNGGDNKPSHTHTYSEQWSHNDSEHWRACTGAECDEVKDKAAHTWDNGNITKEPTCTAKGEKTTRKSQKQKNCGKSVLYIQGLACFTAVML